MWDFLSFRTFVSPYLLILVYYAGAVGIPFLAGTLARRGHSAAAEVTGSPQPPSRLGWRARARVVTGGILLFLGLELGWRLMIELFLAYFQMRDALVLGAG
jgi:hypothetical protein